MELVDWFSPGMAKAMGPHIPMQWKLPNRPKVNPVQSSINA
tara:strand:- start:444 stop:566 length:123 start_codon:yes stop_codon:yes gene_type:complete